MISLITVYRDRKIHSISIETLRYFSKFSFFFCPLKVNVLYFLMTANTFKEGRKVHYVIHSLHLLYTQTSHRLMKIQFFYPRRFFLRILILASEEKLLKWKFIAFYERLSVITFNKYFSYFLSLSRSTLKISSENRLKLSPAYHFLPFISSGAIVATWKRRKAMKN